MNREIKFRVWNPGGKNLLYDIENVYECLKQQLVHDKAQPTRGLTLPYDHKADGMVFMQYTGLKDTKGTEIYEGDIVKSKQKAGGSELYRFIGDVRYSHNGWDVVGTRNWNGTSKKLDGYDMLTNAEVIGNIFQNEDLLKS